MSARRLASAAVLAGLTLAAAAPAISATPTGPTSSGSVLAKRLANRLTHAAGVTASKVTCPATVSPAVGARFNCKASYLTGDRTTIRVRITSARGGFSYALAGLLLRDIEFRIAEDMVQRTKIIADFTCPYRRAVRAGDQFPCYGFESSADSDTASPPASGSGDGTAEPRGKGHIYDVIQLGGGRVSFKMRS